MTAPLAPCRADACRSFGDGHRVHHIRARLAGESPWGWRDAVIEVVDGLRVGLRHLVDEGAPSVWHHRELPVEPGSPVRLHEGFRLLGTPRGWFSVVVEDGLGPVPEPAAAGAWRAEVSPGVVDLATGVAVASDHEADRS